MLNLKKQEQRLKIFQNSKRCIFPTKNMLDQAAAIRKGEELDLDALERYLRSKWPAFESIEGVQQFPGGYSNLTYLLKTNAGEVVLRRPPFGANIKSAHDMSREYRVLSKLEGLFDAIPQPILYCEEESVIGAPFYLMERVEGIILRGNLVKQLKWPPGQMRQVSAAAVDMLARLHSIDIEQTGLSGLGKPDGYIERQVEGWIKRYYKAETDKVPAMDALAEWMRANKPTETPPSLIHNDFKYDNLVLQPEPPYAIRAILDWEMATVGDPLMDLGTTLAYWTEPKEAKLMPLAAANLTWLPGNLNRQEVLERYAAQRGIKIEAPLFYYVYGTFKIGVIVQQIYQRYQKGYTQDPRFADLLKAVQYFGQLGVLALEQQKVSDLL
jgi:aminoglycoside phosphotransferase (APT) family kinase protein